MLEGNTKGAVWVVLWSSVILVSLFFGRSNDNGLVFGCPSFVGDESGSAKVMNIRPKANKSVDRAKL